MEDDNPPRCLLEADLSRARRREVIDAMAAQFILQGWLDARSIARSRDVHAGDGDSEE